MRPQLVKFQRKLSSQLCKEIHNVIVELIELGICIDQNFPCTLEKNDGTFEVNWSDAKNLSITMKNIPYTDIFTELEKDRNFTIKFIDGALIQLQYTILGDKIISHRLAFFPNPNLESYQNDPEVYEKQDLYADILAKNIVPIPIRFDYNDDDELHIDVVHAKSHATFGQYKNCRIPVIGVITPSMFVDFILRNFYSHIHNYYQITHKSDITFERTITTDEEKIIHFNIQTS